MPMYTLELVSPVATPDMLRHEQRVAAAMGRAPRQLRTHEDVQGRTLLALGQLGLGQLQTFPETPRYTGPAPATTTATAPTSTTATMTPSGGVTITNATLTAPSMITVRQVSQYQLDAQQLAQTTQGTTVVAPRNLVAPSAAPLDASLPGSSIETAPAAVGYSPYLYGVGGLVIGLLLAFTLRR